MLGFEMQKAARHVADLWDCNEGYARSVLEQVQKGHPHLTASVIVAGIRDLSEHGRPSPDKIAARAHRIQKQPADRVQTLSELWPSQTETRPQQAPALPSVFEPTVPCKGLAVVAFHDTDEGSHHEAFLQWVNRNPRGYVVNCVGSRFTLHTSDCSCLLPAPPNADDFKSLTANRKLCSNDREDLEQCALRQSGCQVKRCQFCDP